MRLIYTGSDSEENLRNFGQRGELKQPAFLPMRFLSGGSMGQLSLNAVTNVFFSQATFDLFIEIRFKLIIITLLLMT